ncbi:MAG TPA: hypothetical protein VF082_09000, partial [Jiangellaceae bacterium]
MRRRVSAGCVVLTTLALTACGSEQPTTETAPEMTASQPSASAAAPTPTMTEGTSTPDRPAGPVPEVLDFT